MGGRRRHDFGTLRRSKKGKKPRRFLIRIRGRRGRDTNRTRFVRRGLESCHGGEFRSGWLRKRGSGFGLRVTQSPRQALARVFGRFGGGSRPTLVCGDFNAKHNSQTTRAADSSRSGSIRVISSCETNKGLRLACGPPANPRSILRFLPSWPQRGYSAGRSFPILSPSAITPTWCSRSGLLGARRRLPLGPAGLASLRPGEASGRWAKIGYSSVSPRSRGERPI